MKRACFFIGEKHKNTLSVFRRCKNQKNTLSVLGNSLQRDGHDDLENDVAAHIVDSTTARDVIDVGILREFRKGK